MKRCLAVAWCILVSASWASAEIGALCVYTDEAGTSCSFVDNGGPVQVYIIHQYADGVSGSQFRVNTDGTGWTHLDDSWNFPAAIGNSVDGVSIGYGGCLASPFVVGVVSFMGSSAAANTMVRISPDPPYTAVYTVDCDNYARVAAGGVAYVNSTNPCVCNVNPTPKLTVEPGTLDFGSAYDALDLTIINRGGGTLTWNISESLDWLSVSETGGAGLSTVVVTVDRAGLAPGGYSGTIAVTSNAGSESIPVAMTVSPTDPLLRVNPVTIDFTDYLEAAPLLLFNDGASGLTWNITSDQSWLTVTPASGVDNTEVSVMVDRTGLVYGTYYGNLTVTSNGGDQTVSVSMIVSDNIPVLDCTPSSFIFTWGETEKALSITNTGNGQLQWSIASDQAWLAVMPAGGTENGQVLVTVDRLRMEGGTYNGILTVTSNGGEQTVPVEMVIAPASLYVHPVALDFGESLGNRGVLVYNQGEGILTWSVTSDQPWLTVEDGSGTVIGGDRHYMRIWVDRSGLPYGYHSGNLFFTSNGGDQTVPVSMIAQSPLALLDVSPATFHVEAAYSSPDVVNRTLNITNLGADTLQWNVSTDQPWLSALPATGVDDAAVVVTIHRPGTETGLYSGNVLVTSNGGDATVPVTWDELEPQLQVSPTSLFFDSPVDLLYANITNTGGGTLVWSITSDSPWLDFSPVNGINNRQIAITVDRTGLDPGEYTGDLVVTSSGGSETVAVTMHVPAPQPVLSLSPGVLSFGTDSLKTLTVANTGTGILEWQISPNATWLSAIPVSGTCGTNSVVVDVSVDRTGLPDGSHTSSLSVTSNGGNEIVPVDIWVGPEPPALVVVPTSLGYGPDDTTNTFAITNAGDGSLDWTLSADRSWIEIDPPLAGTNDATVTVNVDPEQVPAGPVQTGHVEVASNAGNETVEVRFVRQTAYTGGSIGVFSDAGASGSNFVDAGSLVQVYFFHVNTNGATASQWKFDRGGLPWMHLGDMWNYPTVIGTSVSGVSIGYGSCETGPIFLGIANFFGSAAPACSMIRITADPASPTGNIEGVDCVQNRTFPSGGAGFVNPDGSCGWFPVRHTTWGAIKAMYGPGEEN